MGNLVIAVTNIYDQNKTLVHQFESAEPCQELADLFYQPDLIHFQLTDVFSEEEIASFKISYAAKSFSILDGYQTYFECIKDASMAHKDWKKVKLALVKAHRTYLKAGNIQSEVIKQYFWLSFAVGEILTHTAHAKKHGQLIEFVFTEE